MRFTLSVRSFFSGCLAVALVALTASTASAQSHGRLSDKLIRFCVTVRRQLAGRSRVIVAVQRRRGRRASSARGWWAGRSSMAALQVGEVDNIALATVASDPRVARVMIDRPAFATMERTGQAHRRDGRAQSVRRHRQGRRRRDHRLGHHALTTTTCYRSLSGNASPARRALQGLHARRQPESLVQRAAVGRLRPRHARRRHHRAAAATTRTAAARASRLARSCSA